MSEKELTLLAALAVSYDHLGVWDDKLCGLTDYEGWLFAPLVDNADAFSLLANLNFSVVFSPDFVSVRTYGSNWKEFRAELKGVDRCASLRLAITKAAAEVGEGCRRLQKLTNIQLEIDPTYQGGIDG